VFGRRRRRNISSVDEEQSVSDTEKTAATRSSKCSITDNGIERQKRMWGICICMR
jgi:hypothetical protein